MALPKFILLKSINNQKYLCYRKEEDSKHAFLQFSQEEEEENAEIQYGKFEVQKSQAVEGFVHIRCCYNNKYWVRKSADANSIVVEANEPEEDQSKWSCTLFKVVHLDDTDADGEAGFVADVVVDAEVDVQIPQITKPQMIRLVHSDQLGQHACVQLSNSIDLVLRDDVEFEEEEESVTRTTSSSDKEDVFVAYDATFAMVLPERVALIGHNNKHLAATTVGQAEYLEFKASDIGERGVTHAIIQYPFQQPRIAQFRNTAFTDTIGSGIWKISFDNSPLIVAYHPSNSFRRVYTPIRLGPNVLSLLEPYTTNPIRYVNCQPGLGMDLALAENGSTITQSTMFEITEPVRFRQVSNMVYNLGNSRVYNITSIDKFRDERRNNTSVDQTGSFSVSYTVSQTMNWEDSVTVTRSLSASMSVSIPFVGISFGVEVSSAREQTVTWGNEVTEERTVSYLQELIVPPGKKVTMVVVATRAQCDVPFTCQVQDVVADGQIRNYTKTDGLFLGANEFSFVTNLLEEDL